MATFSFILHFTLYDLNFCALCLSIHNTTIYVALHTIFVNFRLAREVITLLIKNKNLGLIDEALSVFIDVPESSLVDAAIFYLQCKDMEFQGIKNAPQLEMEVEPLEKDIEDSKLYLMFVTR